MVKLRAFFILLFFLLSFSGRAQVDSFFDPSKDYGKVKVRISDKSKSEKTLKFFTKGGNLRFFKQGDQINFNLRNSNDQSSSCQAEVITSEKEYVVVQVRIDLCFRNQLVRRGTMISIDSAALHQRVKEASEYRQKLIKNKSELSEGLRQSNNYLWNYKKRELETAALYDKKLLELEREKQKALEQLRLQKSEIINRQKQFSLRVGTIDKEIDFFRVDNATQNQTAWDYDKKIGLPVEQKPQKIRDVHYKEAHRWEEESKKEM